MYLNTFINLEENITGYGRNSKKPSGHTIITMPGMVRLYLQDLKELTGKKYICYALSKKDNKAVRLGEINDPSENKMTNWRIDINNVLGKGVRADNIDCIAVVIEGNTVGNTDTIMLGYVGEKYLITPLLEKGLPKKELKVELEERKDSTPKTAEKPKQETKIKSVEKSEAKPEIKPLIKPLPKPNLAEKEPEVMPQVKSVVPVEEPAPVIIPVEKSIEKPVEKLKVMQEVKPAVPGEGTVIISTPKACEPGSVAIPEPKPAAPGEGPEPVIMPTPKVSEETKVLEQVKDKEQTTKESLKQIINQLNDEEEVKQEEVKQEEVKKKPCGCQKEHKKDIIEEIIKMLERDGNSAKDLSKVIESELKELIAEGISKDEILNKKNELEIQIKDLLNDKLNIRNNKEEKDIETQLKNELNKQFNLGYRLNADEQELEKNNVELEKQETTREEKDFLEQLEDKLKNIQTLLKNDTEEAIKDIEETSFIQLKEDKRDRKEEYSRIKEIFESSVEIEPFDNQKQPIDWVRISLSELVSIPQIDYEWATQPFITFSYHKFNHLILGRDRELNQYYIGIPDIYHQTRNHILDMDKIERFVCRNTDKLATGEPGYWIAMV